MVASDIMRTEVPAVRPADSLIAAFGLMQEHDLPTLPVLDDGGALIGMIAEGDLIRAALPVFADTLGHLAFLPKSYGFHGYGPAQLRAATVGDLMAREDLVTVEPDTPVAEVAHQMLHLRLRALPVLEQGRLVGLVSRRELVCAILEPHLRCQL